MCTHTQAHVTYDRSRWRSGEVLRKDCESGHNLNSKRGGKVRKVCAGERRGAQSTFPLSQSKESWRSAKLEIEKVWRATNVATEPEKSRKLARCKSENFETGNSDKTNLEIALYSQHPSLAEWPD